MQNMQVVLKNDAGGKISLSGFTAQLDSQVLFNVVDDAQTDGLNEPILLAESDAAMQTQATATFSGRVEETALTIRFSDLVWIRFDWIWL